MFIMLLGDDDIYGALILSLFLGIFITVYFVKVWRCILHACGMFKVLLKSLLITLGIERLEFHLLFEQKLPLHLLGSHFTPLTNERYTSVIVAL